MIRIDWKQPDYREVIEARLANLDSIRAHPEDLPALRAYYGNSGEGIADFISDFGWTYDPRNVERGLPATVPFILFPKQREWILWTWERWRTQTPGATEKSRDCGITWEAVAFACALCIFHPGVAIGFGSRKSEYVDKIGTMKPILPKGRIFMDNLPAEFNAGYVGWRDAPYMRINFPETGSIITGEGGDDIGRGDRASIFFVDEAEHLERPDLVEFALSQTTNCRIDISSVNGSANPVARKILERRIDVFVFDWRAQPLDARVVTPSGLRTVGSLRVGDRVVGSNGLATQVVGVFPQGSKDVYRVKFNDGSSTECCDDHLWSVIAAGDQRASRRHIRHVLPLRELRKNHATTDYRGFKSHRYQVPLTMPVAFDPHPAPINPYVLGCLLGDGSLPKKSTSPVYLTVGDQEIIHRANERLPAGCGLKWVRGIQWRIAADATHRGTKGRGHHNPVNDAVRSLGLSGTESHTKFIPEPYKMGTIGDRLELLRGLMDTDGHAPKSEPGCARYSTTSKTLAEDVQFIAQSLGGTAKIKEFKPHPIAIFSDGRVCQRRGAAFLVSVKLPSSMIPFSLARKIKAYKPAVRFPPRRSIVEIDRIGIKECACIKVAAEDGLYLTDDFIVTHNSDPRKGEEWYAKQKADLDPVVVAQEIDRDRAASVHGVVIPGTWVRAAIGACQKLGFAPTGEFRLALDVADEGRDKNAVVGGKGVEISVAEQWSGRGSDTFATVERAFDIADEHGCVRWRYDGDGLGAGVRGDARVINERRRAVGDPVHDVVMFRGSEAVVDPDGIVEGTIGHEGKGRTNQDYYLNSKSQGWFELRRRFRNVYRWVVEGKPCAPDDIVSLDPKMPNLMHLVAELSQPTYSVNGAGKMVINKTPDGLPSPNLADGAMIHFAKLGTHRTMFSTSALAQIINAPRRRHR